VPLESPVAIAFDFDSSACVPCTRIQGGEHHSKWDDRRGNPYRCKPGIHYLSAFFMESDELPGPALDPGWVESKGHPRFQMSGHPQKDVHFHEWITAKEVVPGKRLACAAYFTGTYPPEKGYNETRGDTTDLPDYTILDRAIYLVGPGQKVEYLWRSSQPLSQWDTSFELAFLPADHSELEDIRFTSIYPVRDGFLLRVNFARDFEGAGSDRGIVLLEFRKGRAGILAAASDTMMF